MPIAKNLHHALSLSAATPGRTLPSAVPAKHHLQWRCATCPQHVPIVPLPHRVSTTDDGDSTIFLGQVGKDVNNAEGTFFEGLHLKDAHRPIHDDSLAVRKKFLLLSRRGRTVV